MRTTNSTVVPHSSADAEDYAWGLERFLDEARTLARFDHPYVNKVHRFFTANGTAYLVLEYVAGQTLSEVLRQQDTLSAEELTGLLGDVLSGLAVVHEAGYVHRDIKPGNLMLRPDGRTIVLDFGAARQAIGQRSKSVTAILTPGYAPLEQYDRSAEDVGPWSDLYGLGMVAYRCISGVGDAELPDAVTRARNARKGIQDLPPAVEVGTGRYPSALLEAIDWAIQVNEDDRPQSVAVWRARLSEEVKVTVSPGSARLAQGPGHPQLGGSGAKYGLAWMLLAVLLVGGLSYGVYHWRTQVADDAAYARAVEAGTLRAYREYVAAYPTGRNIREVAQYQDKHGNTALMRAAAAEEGHTTSVEALLAGGAEPNVQNQFGWTALMGAAGEGHTTSVEALLAGGAEPNVQNEHGDTALMRAAEEGHTTSVEALLAGGAEPNVQNQFGWTALMGAAGEGHTTSVEALLAGGAEPNVQHQFGNTALDIARHRDHTAIVRMLRAAGGQRGRR